MTVLRTVPSDRPVAVGGSARGGVVLAASYEAKAHGKGIWGLKRGPSGGAPLRRGFDEGPAADLT